MTISEIKDLTKFLTDDEVDKIKQEIKNKENVLRDADMDEEEMTQVLNTLFAIMVIEKTLESEIEGVEDIRAELEQELMESYQIYDSHMARVKGEEKKKKKRWLLDFLFLSDRIHSQKEGIGTSDKVIKSMKRELDTLRQQKSNENLKTVTKDIGGSAFEDFCKIPHECRNPHHHHKDTCIHKPMEERRRERFVRNIEQGKIDRPNTPRVKRDRSGHVELHKPQPKPQPKVSVSTITLVVDNNGKQVDRGQPSKTNSR